ncbi:putative baseplate assembly protein [Paraburkholderia sp. JPY432]|uniref:putative baseplate assembly protein n=1 Tax=Paraburkholderia youngii TaxID=2782701 RepID=UPI00159543EA|nr:putative baseplate assembly protein [Paraburkholderia youngii]NVH74231.1 putative baseplate assembly protein [Paraburkholderia youngii]
MTCDACSDGCANCSGSAGCACFGACARAAALGAGAQRLGLSSIDTRIGDYARFFADAGQRLTSADAPALRALATRDPSDPSIALLDAWSVAADVLTFYRDRLANEGYLRTATQEEALRSLAALVDYRPRPGVAASVQLAYTLDPSAAPVTIAAGAQVQSVPQAGEQMQTFETAADLDARTEWSQMTPRRTRVPGIDIVDALTRDSLKLADTALFVRPGERVLFLFGNAPLEQVVREVASAKVDMQNNWVALSLKPLSGMDASDPGAVANVKKLLAIAQSFRARIRQAHSAAGLKAASGQPVLDTLAAMTSVMLGGSLRDAHRLMTAARKGLSDAYGKIADEAMAMMETISKSRAPAPVRPGSATVDAILAQVAQPPRPQLGSSRLMRRSLVDELNQSDTQRGALLTNTSAQLGALLYHAWRALPSGDSPPSDASAVYLLRASASPYGASAPPKPHMVDARIAGVTEWPIAEEDRIYAHADTVVDGIAAGGFAIIDSPASIDESDRPRFLRFARVNATQTVGRSDYGMSGKVTRIELVDAASGALLPVPPQHVQGAERGLRFLRDTVYHVQSERVDLAAEPIPEDVGGGTVMLDQLYDGLDIGRWLIVAGERTDITAGGAPVAGVNDGELMLVSSVSQGPDPASPADTPHTIIGFDKPLVHTYKRASAVVYGNVIAATHGATVSEVLGSGDARQRFASFALSRAPLTFVAAPTTSGVASTAQLRVNTILYEEVDSLLDAGPRDRAYELDMASGGVATATFGDGNTGARLPSGQENVRAAYRAGLGSAGNVDALQISQLATRPLGVTAVINPLPATGGADADGIERIRAGTPLAAQTLAPLARLVSVSDYAIFAQQYAGIGHASAVLLADGTAQCVYVTVAGVSDNPLDPQDALLTSLAASYDAFGDPSMPVRIGVREVIALFIEASVTIDADAEWDAVEPLVRARLADTFSFDARQLGQPAYLSEAIAAIQSVPGVAWTEVGVFGGISEGDLSQSTLFDAAVAKLAAQRRGAPSVPCLPARATGKGSAITLLPAQIVYLLASVPATLVLNLA